MKPDNTASSLPPCQVIVPAAGTGTRMNADIPKQYLPLAGKTVLEWTLLRLLQLPAVSGITVAVRADDHRWQELSLSSDSRIRVVTGGAERNLSVIHALRSLPSALSADHWVLVHDAARPCVALADIARLRHSLVSHPVGGILATPVSDTLKKADSQQQITTTLDRSRVWQAQTPQLFRRGLLQECLERAHAEQKHVTDEASAVEHYGYQPLLIEGQRDNIKITRPEDLALAGWILQQQEITS